VVIDGHDEGLGQEQAPTWNAVTVVAERARRAGVPCVIVSACPTPELLAGAVLLTVDRSAERRGWAAVEVIDRRGDDPRLGLYSERLVRLIRDERRVVCVLNRTGRSRLLACGACGELVSCELCGGALATDMDPTDVAAPGLRCSRCDHRRPSVCAVCNSTRLKVLRLGVSRAREDLETLAGRPVGEVTASTPALPDTDLLVGTEAVLHRLGPADEIGAVVFVDFDQELLASRVRAADEALGLLAHASRLVRGRTGQVAVQTRLPDHPVLRAAVMADPDVLSSDQMEVRRALSLPPFAAVAVISGEGSAAYAEGLRGLEGSPVTLLGPDRDRWLVKAPDIESLAGALAAVARPAGRLRVAVDPARL
jgi:primosomal protein N' (replication factor Y)